MSALRALAALCTLLWLSAAAHAAPGLDALFAQEIAELTATRDGLRAELAAAQQQRTRQARAQQRTLSALQAQLADAQALELAARAQAQQVTHRTASAADDAALLDSTLRAAGNTLRGLGDTLPDGEPGARLVDALQRMVTHLHVAGAVRAAPGRFFDAEGRPREGERLHVGRIAQLGLADDVGGPLRPAGDDALTVVADGRAAARALRAGQDAAQAPVFVYDSSGPVPPVAREHSLLDVIRSAGLIGWVIVGLGIMALLIAVERALSLALIGAGKGVTTVVCARLHAGDLAGARDALAGPGALRRVMGVLLAEPDEPHAHLEEVAARAVLRELPRLERLLPLLRTAAAVAPLLGLLGTVTGMIATFDIITEYGTGDPKRLSGGISQALVTTELGLAVAIPTLLLHTLLDRWASRILSRLQTDSLVAIHELACHRPADHPHAHHHHPGDHGHHPGATHTHDEPAG